MSASRTIVLKFGSSVLRAPSDAVRVVHEIYRWVRDGWKVVAVVSAFEGETDQLLSLAQSWDSPPHSGATALLASTGELKSAAVLALALDRAGLDAQVLDEGAIGLRTSGENPLDAQPRSLDAAKVKRILARSPVLVVPGFLGRDSLGRTTLLGRGGSDCSALFLAQELGARCRLVKDVDGLYEWDPQTRGPAPRRFARLSWSDALKLDGGIVQHKAIEFAQQAGQAFEVGGLFRREATHVGHGPPAFAPRQSHSALLRVVLLGLGNVGRGVFEAVRNLPETFEVVGVSVREEARAAGIPRSLWIEDLQTAVDTPCDILVELIGDPHPAYRAIRQALQAGRHVVSANKRVLATHGAELEHLALRRGVSLRWSAAVGGAVPLLEQLPRISPTTPRASLSAVLNGTTNFVLDRWQAGLSIAEALDEARAAGFAEADATRDLEGLDAADKLVLIHRQLTGEWLPSDLVERTGLDVARLDRWPRQARPHIRQIARWQKVDDRCCLSISLRQLAPRHPLARLKRQENGALIRLAGQKPWALRGKGAGRWPTAEAVTADLLDLAGSVGPAMRQVGSPPVRETNRATLLEVGR
jgi:homoserine dehydrogenase